MRGAEWIDWTRTRLQPGERENLLTHERNDMLTALTAEQQQHLLEHDYVWVKGSGVLWKPPGGALRRLWRRSQRGPGERRAAEARARFWAEVREGQREAEAHSRP